MLTSTLHIEDNRTDDSLFQEILTITGQIIEQFYVSPQNGQEGVVTVTANDTDEQIVLALAHADDPPYERIYLQDPDASPLHIDDLTDCVFRFAKGRRAITIQYIPPVDDSEQDSEEDNGEDNDMPSETQHNPTIDRGTLAELQAAIQPPSYHILTSTADIPNEPGVHYIVAANGIFKIGQNDQMRACVCITPFRDILPNLALMMPYVVWKSWPGMIPGEAVFPVILEMARNTGEANTIKRGQEHCNRPSRPKDNANKHSVRTTQQFTCGHPQPRRHEPVLVDCR